MANHHTLRRQGQPPRRQDQPQPREGRAHSPPLKKGRRKHHNKRKAQPPQERRARTKPRDGRASPHHKKDRPSANPRGKGQPYRKNLSKPKKEVSANHNPKKSQPPTPRRNGQPPTTRRNGQPPRRQDQPQPREGRALLPTPEDKRGSPQEGPTSHPK